MAPRPKDLGIIFPDIKTFIPKNDVYYRLWKINKDKRLFSFN